MAYIENYYPANSTTHPRITYFQRVENIRCQAKIWDLFELWRHVINSPIQNIEVRLNVFAKPESLIEYLVEDTKHFTGVIMSRGSLPGNGGITFNYVSIRKA